MYNYERGIVISTKYGFILSVIGINGVPEAIVAAVITACVGKILLRSKLVTG